MKRFFVFAIFFLTMASTAGAQHFIVRGGVNYASGIGVTDLKEQYKGIAGWEAGIGYQTSSLVGFTFQPELYYKQKGVETPDFGKVKFSYVQLPFNIQWGPNLVVFRPYVFLGPYIAYNFKATSSEGIDMDEIANDFKGGIGGGLGLEIWKFQLVFRYDYDFGPLADWESYGKLITDLVDMDNLGKGCMELSIAIKL